jgi:uridine kinase
MRSGNADVHVSVSTWRQPLPAPASATRSALVERVAGAILALGPGRLRVGIDGLTAAGKTSFGHELAEWISHSGRSVLRASLDDFKQPWRDHELYDRVTGEGYYRNAFNYPSVRQLLLEPFADNGSGECVLCGIDALSQVDHSAITVRAAPDSVLIVDGVFAFRPDIFDCWEYRIWLEVDAETSIRRGAQRDQDWAGSDAEAVHRDRYLPAERIYLAEVDPVRLVDVVIDNTDLARPRLMRG